MSKVFGMHMIALKPGVKAEDFEKFVTEKVYSLWPEGWQVYLLKGDRGDREGKYLWVYELVFLCIAPISICVIIGAW